MIPSAASSAEIGVLCGIGGADAEPVRIPAVSTPNAAMSSITALLANAQVTAPRTAQFVWTRFHKAHANISRLVPMLVPLAGCAATEAILSDGLCKPQPCGGACLSGNRPRPAGHHWTHRQPPSQCLHARARQVRVSQAYSFSAAHGNLTCAGSCSSAMQGCCR